MNESTKWINFMELSPSWEASQETDSLLWSRKFDYGIHKSPPVVPILAQMNRLCIEILIRNESVLIIEMLNVNVCWPDTNTATHDRSKCLNFAVTQDITNDWILKSETKPELSEERERESPEIVKFQ